MIDSLSLNKRGLSLRIRVCTGPQLSPPSREELARIALVPNSPAGALTLPMASAIWCAVPSGPNETHGSEARA